MDLNRSCVAWRALVLVALQVLPAALSAAPPANDSFSNRFVIVSSPTVVTTSLAEATIDPETSQWGERYWNSGGYGSSGGFFPSGIGSLWWTATLTNPCSFTVELLEHSDAERIAVWEHIWVDYCQCRRGGVWASANAHVGQVPYTTIRAYGSTNLDVQLTGNAPLVALRFTIHTAPLIIIPPQSRTVSGGDSVFFGVAATGHSALQHQWLHNGQPMPGKTFPILSLDHVTAAHAGTYRVIITDDLGTNSADVTLTVSETDVPPRWRTLQRTSTNEWLGLLEAEAGRSYRIESSTNLVDWSPVTRLTQESSVRYGTAGVVSNSGVVFLPDASSEVRFRTASPHEFFRAVRFNPTNSECFNNLKKIRFAKELWAYPFLGQWPDNSAVRQQSDDIDLFGSTRFLPTKLFCPLYSPQAGGLYKSDEYASQPSCQLHSSTVEPSW